MIAAFTHGPGLVHANKPVEKLEDMKGLKLRGPTRMTNKLLEKLGAIPVGMPVPAVPEALSKHAIDGAVVPWEVSVPLCIPELVHHHTGFSGSRGLYTFFMVFAMNKAKYDSLPNDLKKVIDDNSGREASRLAGLAMDKGDEAGPPALAKIGDKQTILDEAETQRWKDMPPRRSRPPGSRKWTARASTEPSWSRMPRPRSTPMSTTSSLPTSTDPLSSKAGAGRACRGRLTSITRKLHRSA